MSYNPNKAKRNRTWKALEKLYDALRDEGTTLKGIEISKPLFYDGDKPIQTVKMAFGAGYNMRHIKVTTKGIERKV